MDLSYQYPAGIGHSTTWESHTLVKYRGALPEGQVAGIFHTVLKEHSF